MRIERGLRLERIWTLRNIAVHLLVLLPIIAASAILVPVLSFTPAVPRWVTIFAVAVLLGLATPLALFTIHRHLFADQIASAYIAAGRCAACGYGLASATVEPDGCRVCPECSAAWRRQG